MVQGFEVRTKQEWKESQYGWLTETEQSDKDQSKTKSVTN